jgi:putative membrane protein
MRYAQTRLIRISGTTAALGTALMVANVAFAAPKDASARKDQHFMAQAIQGDLSEIQMGKLAQEKGQSDQVKDFGKTLEQDHSEHLQKAQQMAQQDGFDAPAEPNAKQKATYERMSGMSGRMFDAAFARDMVRDHEKDIRDYEKEANSGSRLADFARQTVPVLKKHLEIAQSLLPSRGQRRQNQVSQ